MTKLGYGLAKLPMDENGQVNEIKALKIIEQAIREGIEIFDTSPFYLNGKSEEILGKVLEKNKNRINISTKISLKDFNNKQEFLEKFEQQLTRLKSKNIDYYLIHGFDEERLEKFNTLEVWKWLKALQQEGKIRYIGFSFHGKINLLKKIVDLYNWDVCMIKFSPLDEHFETGEKGIEYLRFKNIKIFLIQPYFGGVYTELIDTTERKKGLFYKVWESYNIDTIFVGTRNSEHLSENIEIMKGYQKDANVEKTIKKYEELKKNYIENKTIKCDGCNDCNICPKKIAISYIFMVYNIFKITKNKEKFIYNYETIINKHGNYRKRM